MQKLHKFINLKEKKSSFTNLEKKSGFFSK